jgi:hypothetical protein
LHDIEPIPAKTIADDHLAATCKNAATVRLQTVTDGEANVKIKSQYSMISNKLPASPLGAYTGSYKQPLPIIREIGV